MPQSLGDFTSTLPDKGGGLLLAEGDLILIYGDETSSNIIKISSWSDSGGGRHRKDPMDEDRKKEEQYHLQIEGVNPGSCAVHFYLVVSQTGSLLSHLTPDNQPLDFYPSLLRSHLQPDQYLSHLFTISVHVQDYSQHSSSELSDLGCHELTTVLEMAQGSSVHDETQEVILCSQFFLTKVMSSLYVLLLAIISS
jgi:hypothetical protein